MLTNETMGLFCLGVVWLNTLLIVAHVWQAQRALERAQRSIGDVVRAEVLDTRGAKSLALLHVSQLGRAITQAGPSRILFTESSRRGEIHAAIVEQAGARVEVVPGEGEARVWCVGASASRCDDDFERAFDEAKTSRGFASEACVEIGVRGGVVWLAGVRDDTTMRVSFVSDRDPASLVASARARALAFVASSVLVLVGITGLSLVRPWFSGVSTLGGALAVAFFLAVQPIANALRESIAVPPLRPIGGLWQRRR